LKHEGTKAQRHEELVLIDAEGFETRRHEGIDLIDAEVVKHEGTKARRHEGIRKLDGVKNGNLLLFLLKKNSIANIIFKEKKQTCLKII
jgi:hypothetical protein